MADTNAFLFGARFTLCRMRLLARPTTSGGHRKLSGELDNLHVVVVPEPAEALGAGAVPLVDGLVVVSNHEQIGAPVAVECPQQQVLAPVGVLILVHAGMRVHYAVVPSDTGTVMEKAQAAHQECAEVEMVTFDEEAEVRLVDRTKPLPALSRERQRLVLAFPTALPLPQETVDHGQHALRRQPAGTPASLQHCNASRNTA